MELELLQEIVILIFNIFLFEYSCYYLGHMPVAPVAQRYLVSLWHVGTWVQPRQTGFFSLKNWKTNAQRVEND